MCKNCFTTENSYNESNIGILFSGGLDSTYLVWKTLTEGKKVTPIYLSIGNNGPKTTLEKNRTNLLWEKFREEFPDLTHSNIIEPIEVLVKKYDTNLSFKQIPIWILGMLFTQNVAELQIGYTVGDDALGFLDDIQSIYNSYSVINDRQLVPIKFPLTKITKMEMASVLPETYLDLIVSCEEPRIRGDERVKVLDYEACGSCAACKRIISSNYYGLHEFPKCYKQGLLSNAHSLVERFGYKVVRSSDNQPINAPIEPSCRRSPYQLEIDFDGLRIEPDITMSKEWIVSVDN